MTILRTSNIVILTQTEMIRKEILSALDAGLTDKQLIYNTVAQKTNTPRPTIRRVASQLKKELIAYHEILASSTQERVATNYDCPECNTKKVISKGMLRCPKCQVVLDWSDES